MSDSSSTWAAINTGRTRHYFIGNGMESLCKREYVPSIYDDESKFARCVACSKILDAMTPEERADIVIGDALDAGRKWLTASQVRTMTDMDVLLHEAKRSQKVMRRVLNTGRPAVESQAVSAYTLAWDALTLARSLTAPTPAEGPTEPAQADSLSPATEETPTMTGTQYTSIELTSDVTNEIAIFAITIADNHYPTGRIDWEDLWDRLDGVELKDGTRLDLGSDLTTPAIGKLKRAVQANRR